MDASARQGHYLPHYVYDDYVQWEGRWELISGIAHAMTPAPSIEHQLISQRIAQQLGLLLEGCDRCHALLPVDWKVAEDTVLQPDNLVVCYEPVGPYLTKAPSLIFEIVSRKSHVRDVEIKFAIYEREGVKYYCLVFPEEGLVKVFVLRGGRYSKLADVTNEKIEFDLVAACRFSFDFGLIWGA
ncbi:MAG: Uma2 family endonuclease [Thermodesulfobacteriota bacterium]